MTLKIWSGAATFACAAGLAILGFASTACALDAYWLGSRSNQWTVGPDPSNQVSNWYRDPAYQMPVPMPDRTAIFAGTAARDVPPELRRASVTIDRIRIEPDAAPFEVGVAGELIINGAGIVNQSAATPLFNISGHMEFHGASRLTSVGARSAAFRLSDTSNFGGFLGVLLSFQGTSKGGDAAVETLHNNTFVQFVNQASAQNMMIANLFGHVDFFDRSSGGNAELVNHLQGRTEFHSVGPAQNGIVTIGAIRNDGLLTIGQPTTLVVQRDLVLNTFAQGRLRFRITKGRRTGEIVVRGKARLGGDLIVDAFSDIAVGSHRLITAVDALTGRFRAHRLRLPDHLRGRIVYSGTAVTLIVERK